MMENYIVWGYTYILPTTREHTTGSGASNVRVQDTITIVTRLVQVLENTMTKLF